MTRNEHEKYGFGPSLATKQQRLARAAIAVMLVSALGALVVALRLLTGGTDNG